LIAALALDTTNRSPRRHDKTTTERDDDKCISQHCLPACSPSFCLSCVSFLIPTPPQPRPRPPHKICLSLFSQAIHSASIVRLPPLPCISLPPFLSHLRLLPQGPLTQNVKRSMNITNPNADPVSFKIKTTAPKVLPSRASCCAGLIHLPSCTAYGPTPERSTLVRRLKFKVQYIFSCSMQWANPTCPSDASSNERRTATECQV
jgi:hypothetical protein